MRLQARDTKGPSMEQNCKRAKRTACGIGRPGSCLFFHLQLGDLGLCAYPLCASVSPHLSDGSVNDSNELTQVKALRTVPGTEQMGTG